MAWTEKGKHDRTWRARWRDPRSNSTTSRGGFRHRADALTYAKRMEREAREAIEAERAEGTAAAIPLSELIRAWREAKAGNRDAGPTAYRVSKACEAAGWGTVRDITPESAARWMENGSKRTGACLRAILNWGRVHRAQPVAPLVLDVLRPGKVSRREPGPVLSRDRVLEVIASAYADDENWGLAVECLARFGWRPMDVATMEPREVSPTGFVSKHTKHGGHIRTALPQDIHDAMAPWMDRPRIFHDWRRAEWTAWETTKNVGLPAAFRARFGFGVYELKRFAITKLLQRLSAADVVLITGHRDTKSLEAYRQDDEAYTRDLMAKTAI